MASEPNEVVAARFGLYAIVVLDDALSEHFTEARA
jgi:hypothetical protein